MIETLTLDEIVLRLVAAALLGALLGLNRERRGKPAGLRTITLVSVGAASFTLVALELFVVVPDTSEGVSRLDLTRVVQGVVGGIGFLGAGCIIQARGSVVGTTTAATIWTVGAVGLACGLGQVRLALAITLISWTILVGLGYVEQRWLGNVGERGRNAYDRSPPSG